MGRLAVCLLVVLAACGPPKTTSTATVATPAELRVVALAPHLAELMFAAGAGVQLVGVSSYSDYPADVRNLPVVGDAFRIDQEQLALLRADLLLAWGGGTPAHIVDALRERGYRVELIRTASLSDIAAALLRIGELTGRVETARNAAATFERDLAALAARWQDAAEIRVFYQVSLRPLYTVNGRHYISELISLCGGHNVFAELNELAPMISEEAVLDRDPEVILSAATSDESTARAWGYWSNLAANRYANHFTIPADAVARPTPRVVAAGSSICAALQQARQHRAQHATGSSEP
jgi:iron complex transport system substrate-binding protein